MEKSIAYTELQEESTFFSDFYDSNVDSDTETDVMGNDVYNLFGQFYFFACA